MKSGCCSYLKSKKSDQIVIKLDYGLILNLLYQIK